MYKDNKDYKLVWLLPSQMCGSCRSWPAPQRTSPLWRSCRWSRGAGTRWQTRPRWAPPPARCRTLRTLPADQPDEILGFCSQQVCVSRDLESKLSRIVVHATAVHEAEHVLDSFVGKNPLSCDRTYASVCQGACHHGHALAVHLQAAGLGGEIVFKSCWYCRGCLEVEVEDVLDVDTTASVVCSIGEATLLPHEVGQGVVSVCGVPELPGFTLFHGFYYLSERKVEFWKPTFCPPAILIGMKNGTILLIGMKKRNNLIDWDEK